VHLYHALSVSQNPIIVKDFSENDREIHAFRQIWKKMFFVKRFLFVKPAYTGAEKRQKTAFRCQYMPTIKMRHKTKTSLFSETEKMTAKGRKKEKNYGNIFSNLLFLFVGSRYNNIVFFLTEYFMDQTQRRALVPIFLNFGEAMMAAGAEISRVEDSLSRIGASYGALRTEVFAITASLVLTLRFEDEEFTGTRRITSTGSNDFEKLHKLNELSRECVEKHLSPKELSEGLDRISASVSKPLPLYIGSAIASGAFAIFFGGGIFEGLFAALFGLLICLFQEKLEHRFSNKAFSLFVISLLVGCSACLLAKLLPFLALQIDKIIIGDIMLIVPGIATTMAVRDMLIGDTISGVTKLLECLLWAACLAAGFILALMLCGR